MSGFDRIKPPDRRLREREEARQPTSSEADPAGRAALFSAAAPSAPAPDAPAAPSAPPPPVDDGTQPGARRSSKVDGAPTSADDPRLPQERSPLHVECGHCGVSCPLPLGHALRQVIPLVVLAPWKSHPVFATCPCGERRAWLKPSIGLPR